jgi:hypothetical protein
MPNRNPPPGKRFVKGQVPNPRGAGAHNKEVKALRRLTHEAVAEVGSLILEGNKEELEKVVKNPDASALKVWMSGVALDGIKYRNVSTLNALLDRIVGKPKEDNQVTLISKNGDVEGFTKEQALEQFKKAQEKC